LEDEVIAKHRIVRQRRALNKEVMAQVATRQKVFAMDNAENALNPSVADYIVS